MPFQGETGSGGLGPGAVPGGAPVYDGSGGEQQTSDHQRMRPGKSAVLPMVAAFAAAERAE
jgi:hypothetical protein